MCILIVEIPELRLYRNIYRDIRAVTYEKSFCVSGESGRAGAGIGTGTASGTYCCATRSGDDHEAPTTDQQGESNKRDFRFN